MSLLMISSQLFSCEPPMKQVCRTFKGALKKLLIEQTKSRQRKTNDNALAESKNASTVRKYLGYSHIPQHFASHVNVFTVEVLSPSAPSLPPLPPPLPAPRFALPNRVHGRERADTQALPLSGGDDAL